MLGPYGRIFVAAFSATLLYIAIQFWTMGFIGAAIAIMLIAPLKLP